LKRANDEYWVLLVDDNHSLLTVIDATDSLPLCGNGGGGCRAQALAHTRLLQPHLIITYLKMNGTDDMTLFNQAHTRNPSLPVLILGCVGDGPDLLQPRQNH
jgi:DNA-binding NtrC family response regulator